MDLELTDTHKLIAKTARDYAERAVRPIAAEIDRTERFPLEIVKGLADLGLMGVNIPADLGGAEAGVVSYALAMMEISRACASTAVAMAVTNMVAEVIARFGTKEQRERHVPRITSGEHVTGAFALSEPEAGSDPGAMRTTAERTADGWVLRGEKQWITNGAYAGVHVVWARTGGPGTRGISTFLVEGGTPGLTCGKPEEKMGVRGSNTVPVTFDDCKVPHDALLGEEGQGFKVAMMALDGGRIGIASQAIGIATAALEEAVQYAKDRKTFGKPIAEHQLVKEMIAEMATDYEACRLLWLKAGWLKNEGKRNTRETSLAKMYGCACAEKAASNAVQVHGAYGFSSEYNVERFYRNAKGAQIYEGSREIHKLLQADYALGSRTDKPVRCNLPKPE